MNGPGRTAGPAGSGSAGPASAVPPPGAPPPAGPARAAGPAPAAAAEPRTARRPRLLIVEDEPALLRALRIGLRARGYEVLTAVTGRDALSRAAEQPPDAVLLDLGLPDQDGTSVIGQLRERSAVPIIVLSGRTGVHDKIGALDAGADDYVGKPFAMDELLARLRAALRREDSSRPAAVVMIGRWRVDRAARTITGAAAGQPPAVHLTPTEWRLLEVLLRSPGQLVSPARILAEVWGAGHERHSYYLRFHMAGLRRKLEDDPPRPRHLLTEPGMGYRYQP